ncbi:hypothetical protein GGR51DRAFT_522406, partial [Nemania sp. FL0031]
MMIDELHFFLLSSLLFSYFSSHLLLFPLPLSPFFFYFFFSPFLFVSYCLCHAATQHYCRNNKVKKTSMASTYSFTFLGKSPRTSPTCTCAVPRIAV